MARNLFCFFKSFTVSILSFIPSSPMLCLCIFCLRKKEKVGNEVVVKAKERYEKRAENERSQGTPRALPADSL